LVLKKQINVSSMIWIQMASDWLWIYQTQ
jgi:hypothetical protein